LVKLCLLVKTGDSHSVLSFFQLLSFSLCHLNLLLKSFFGLFRGIGQPLVKLSLLVRAEDSQIVLRLLKLLGLTLCHLDLFVESLLCFFECVGHLLVKLDLLVDTGDSQNVLSLLKLLRLSFGHLNLFLKSLLSSLVGGIALLLELFEVSLLEVLFSVDLPLDNHLSSLIGKV